MRKPLLIGIVGEIDVMLEPFVYQHIVRQLGKMGVLGRLGDWIK